MDRRLFLLAGSLSVLIRSVARGDQVPIIGYLYVGSRETSEHIQKAFKAGLAESGFVEGKNVAFEYRWADNVYARLPELANDLVRQNVTVIATPSATSAARAAKAATSTIPIVFSGGGDPVQAGLVKSLNRPDGNATGVAGLTTEIGAKRLELLKEVFPEAKRFAVLSNPATMDQNQIDKMKTAAQRLGCDLIFQYASVTSEIEQAFVSLARIGVEGIVIEPETMFINSRNLIAFLSLTHHLPTISPFREDVAAGGLMSYGPSITDNARLAGVYTGRILKGEKPSNLPVLQPIKFDLVLNMKTAKSVKANIPGTLVARADEVIE